MVHEPPLLALLAGDEVYAPVRRDVRARLDDVVTRIGAGDPAGAAERFVESVALGPGTWAQLPREIRQTFVENAPTFLDEVHDPDQLVFELDWIRTFSRPVLLSRGAQSPPLFAPVVTRLAEAIPHAEVVTFPHAGHIPHTTQPDAYVDAILAFTARHAR